MKDINDILSNLTPQEKEATLKILNELQEKGKSDALNDLYTCDYEEIPVDIGTFMTDRRYAGEFTSGGKNIYPYWQKQLKEIFSEGSAYSEVALTGSIGIGKSTIAVLGLAYVLYNLMCLKDPHDFYNIGKGGYIYIVFFNATLALSQGVAYTKLQGLLQMSPWFMERGKVTGTKNLEYIPNKPIRFTVGSQMEHSLGKDIFAGMLDEINFVKGADVHMEQSKIMKTYNCLHGDTEVVTTDGVYKIKDINGTKVCVYAKNKYGGVDISKPSDVKNTSETFNLVSIELEDGTVIKVTPEHKLMLSDGTYKEAQYLTENDVLMEDINMDNVFDIRLWEQFNIKSYLWLNRYIRFMKNICDLGDRCLDVKEKHHILPKSFMLNDLTVNLTSKEHFIAHKMLCRCFTDNNYVFLSQKHIDCIKQTRLGYVYIHKNYIDKYVKMEDLDLYLNDGYILGKYSDSCCKSVVNRNGNIHFINTDDLNDYLEDGYELGVNLQLSDNMIYVHKGCENILVNAENIYYYLDSDYRLGKSDLCEN